MKKVLSSIFVVGLLSISSAAIAGDNSETIIPPTNNEEGNQNGEKTKSKYSFTLFSFFNADEGQTKTDSSKTNEAIIQPKSKLKVNSDL